MFVYQTPMSANAARYVVPCNIADCLLHIRYVGPNAHDHSGVMADGVLSTKVAKTALDASQILSYTFGFIPLLKLLPLALHCSSCRTFYVRAQPPILVWRAHAVFLA